MGATAGRTTLTGEGLQHDDGHSHLLASTIPNIRAYDPAYAYELAAIVRDGIERMYVRGRGRLLLRHAVQRELPDAAQARTASTTGSSAGIYRFSGAARVDRPQGRAQGARAVRLVGSGSILQQVIAAQALLAEQFGIAAEVYSATVVPAAPPRRPRARALEPAPPGPAGPGPVRQPGPRARRRPDRHRHRLDSRPCPTWSRRWLPRDYVSLGTDGFGRSDTREAPARAASRSTRRRSPRRRWPPSPAAARLTAGARPPRRSASSGSIRTGRRPSPSEVGQGVPSQESSLPRDARGCIRGGLTAG